MTLKPAHTTNPDQAAADSLQSAWELELPGPNQPTGPADWFYHEERERLILENLRQFFPNRPLDELSMLDLGCIRGDILPLLLSHGAQAENLHACGLIKPTLAWLNTRYPQLHTVSIRPNPLPFNSEQFDIIFLFSMFGLMFDGTARQHVALEAERMLKPGGCIFWCDLKPVYEEQREWQRRIYHWLSLFCRDDGLTVVSVPGKGSLIDTQPVDRVEIELLFSDCLLRKIQETGMYRPVANRLAKRSTRWLHLASRLPLLKTHYFAVLQKQAEQQDPALVKRPTRTH